MSRFSLLCLFLVIFIPNTSITLILVMITCRHLFRSLATVRQFLPATCHYKRNAFHTQDEQSLSQIGSSLDTTDSSLRENGNSLREMVSRLDSILLRIREGGGEEAKKRHVSRGKLLPRDRISLLVDPGSSFLELSPLAGETPSTHTAILFVSE